MKHHYLRTDPYGVNRRARRLESQARRLRAVLRKLEWCKPARRGDSRCPVCNVLRIYGAGRHRPKCLLAIALRRPRASR